MKFVYFGYDFMLGAAQRLVADGHEILAIMSFPCDNMFNFNTRCQELAQQKNIPITLDKVTPERIETLINQGAELFLSAGYLYKIPPVDESKAYGINFHPTYLPMGRGLMPTPHILMQEPQAAGMTIHKLAQDFDTGDILAQQKIIIDELEDVETYCARIALHGPDLIAETVADLDQIWDNARPQDETESSHFPPPSDEMRMLDWNKSIEEIEKTARAFGRYGSLARFGNHLYAIYNLKGWKERHDLAPGTIACMLSREAVIAAKDGFICLKEMQQLQS